MKTIKIKNELLLLDDSDYELLKDSHIRINKARGKTYAQLYLNNKKRIYIHTWLVKSKHKITHLDGNTMNCQRANLKILDYTHQKLVKKIWESKNLDKNKESGRRSYKKHRLKRLAAARAWSNSSHGKQVLKSFKRTLKSRYNRGKYEASITRYKEFSISFEEYCELMNTPCFYTGESLIGDSGIGLDRIDNSLGYVLSNVLPCKGWVNKLRGDWLTVEETQIAVNAILNFRNLNKVA